MNKIENKIKIYHNNRCKISREGLQILENKKIDFEIIDYMKSSLSVKDMEMLLMKLNCKPQVLVRTNESIYKSKFKGQQFNDDEWIKILIEYPNLMQRPIVETQYKAVVARPLELIDELLDSTKKTK